jgi:hypothetical protein
MTQVYSNQLMTQAGSYFFEIVLDQTFQYNNSDNLIVAIVENTYGNPLPSLASYRSAIANSRSILYTDDDIEPNPSTPPTGVVKNQVSSLKLSYIDGPTIVVNESLSEFYTCAGNSDLQSLVVSAYQLTHDLNISAPTGYEISLNSSSGFGSSLSLSQNAGEVDTTSIYVRLNSSSSNGVSGNLVFTSNGAFTVNTPTGDGIVGMDSIYVSSSGSNSNYGTSISSPYANLAYAISKVRCPSTVISVAAGTYADDLLDISGVSNLSIEGNGMGSTIFDQSGSGDHFLEIKGNSNNISISGMTIKDYDENNNGGALDITATGFVILEDIHFNNNRTASSYDDGGAVYISSNSTVTIDRCKFTNNSSYNSSTSNGSCIYSEGNLNLYNTLFYDNTCNYGNSTTYSGHVYLRTESSGSQTSIINCTFTENNNGNPVLYYDGASGKHFQQNNLFF